MTSSNRKILLMEMNQPLLSRKVTHYAHQKGGPAPVLDFNSVSRRNYKSSKKPLLIVEASLRYFDLMKEAIILICDSTSRSEILG